jgi:hypothetical protein
LVFDLVFFLASFFVPDDSDLEAFFTVSFFFVSAFLAVFFLVSFFFVSVSVAFADEVEDDVEVVELEVEELLEVEALVVFALEVVFFAVDCLAAPPPGLARQNALTFDPLDRTCAATNEH